MDRAVGVGEDEFPEAVRGVVGAHEATLNPGGGPFCVQGVGVRHVDVDHAASTFRSASDSARWSDTAPRSANPYRAPSSNLKDETKAPIAIHRRVEVGHVHDRCDLLELDLVHGFLESSSATLLGATFDPQVKHWTARISAQSQPARTAYQHPARCIRREPVIVSQVRTKVVLAAANDMEAACAPTCASSSSSWARTST